MEELLDESQDLALSPSQGWESFDDWRRRQGMLENTSEKQGNPIPQRDPATGRLLPGSTANPNGRPPGAQNFKTIFEKALRQVAALNKLDPDDLYAQIISQGIAKARSGDYRYYKDTLDRLHGKAKETFKGDVDVTSGGLPIQGGNQITFVNFSGKNQDDAPKSQP